MENVEKTEEKKEEFDNSALMGSGLLFIGDPRHLAGTLSEPGSEKLVDPVNPFKNFPLFLAKSNQEDYNVPMPDSLDTVKGGGIVIQTYLPECKYKVEKIIENGKLKELRVIFNG